MNVSTRRIGWAVGMAVLSACSGGQGGGTADAGEDPVKAIVNGATQAAVTTYWLSESDKGCIVGGGSNPRVAVCAGPLNLALAADGTAVWSSNYAQSGSTTWTKLGADAIIINALPFNPPSLNISAISGGFSLGYFVGDASGYSAIRFTLQSGPVPGYCAPPRKQTASACVDPATDANACGSALADCTTTVQNATGSTCTAGACDYGSCSAGFGDCDGNRANGCEASLADVLNATGVACGAHGLDYAECNTGFADCDGNRANGCEASLAAVLNATGVACGTQGLDYTACDSGFGDCDGNRSNGCETSLTGVLNATGVACGAHGPDYSACDPGFGDCDGNRSNGCEQNISSQTATMHASVVTCQGNNFDYGTCDSGYADCDGNRGNGCEADLTTLGTSMHASGITCSAPGIFDYAACDTGYSDCNGNTTDGCEQQIASCARRLAATSTTPYHLVIDSTNIYWTEATALKRVALGGGTPATLARGSALFGLTVDASNVYYVEHATGQLLAVSLSGGTPPTLPRGTDVYDIAVNAADVYWTNCASDNGWVSEASRPGGAAVTLSPVNACPNSIILDAHNLYWTDTVGVWQQELVSGNEVRLDTVGNRPSGPAGLAVDATSVYWASNTGVFSAPLGGGTAVTIGADNATAAVAVDDAYVYWSHVNGTGLSATTKDGLTSTTLPTDFNPSVPALSIAVDANSVYWLTASGVMTTPKP